jgi:hypothetical protein
MARMRARISDQFGHAVTSVTCFRDCKTAASQEGKSCSRPVLDCLHFGLQNETLLKATPANFLGSTQKGAIFNARQ